MFKDLLIGNTKSVKLFNKAAKKRKLLVSDNSISECSYGNARSAKWYKLLKIYL